MATAMEFVRIILEYFGWEGDEIEVSYVLSSDSTCLLFVCSIRVFKLNSLNFKPLCFESQVLFYGGRRFRDRRRSIVRRIGRELARYQFSLFTKRSIIREIGSRLPLKPCKRPYFEVN